MAWQTGPGPEPARIYFNSAWLQFVGRDIDSELGFGWASCVHQDDLDRYFERVIARFKARTPYEIEYRLLAACGSYRHVREIGTPSYTKNGEFSGFVGHVFPSVVLDGQSDSGHVGPIDYLTGLPSRFLVEDRFGLAIERAKRKGKKVAVLCIDIDHFREVNQVLGNSVGDGLIQQAADRISATVRATDTVVRFGGDEFLVVLEDISTIEDVSCVAEKLIAVLSAHYEINNVCVESSASIGACIWPEDGSDFEAITKRASSALSYAKGRGRNRHCFFTPEMNLVMEERRELEIRLKKALANKEFVLHYQPQFDLHSDHLVGVEALIRWQSPDLGMVSPAKFIPVAEQTGLIVDIGQWVIREAFRQHKLWTKEGKSPVTMAINLSAVQILQSDVVSFVQDALLEYGLNPALIEFEITESTLLENLDQALVAVNGLRSLGVKLAMDDFGTGYSSLSYLKRFQFDKIKIDRSFVSGDNFNHEDASIIRAIIQLGHSLSLKVIAEGVENEEQVAYLQKEGCNEVQGFLFGRPAPANIYPSTSRLVLLPHA